MKWLSIVDEFTRECLCLKVDRSITSEDVLDTLAELFAIRGVPNHIRSDNGPEFVAHAIRRWLGQLDVEAMYIEPGSPWENGYAESFHSRFRDEFLVLEEFENLAAARTLTAVWKTNYNDHRPHSSLAYRTPSEFARRHTSAQARQTGPPRPPSPPPQPQPVCRPRLRRTGLSEPHAKHYVDHPTRTLIAAGTEIGGTSAALDRMPVPFLTHLREPVRETARGYLHERELREALRAVKRLFAEPRRDKD